MSRMSRTKGRRAERHVTNWLNANGFPHAEPRSTGMAGADVAELGPGLELEIKNHARLAFGQWIDQLERAMLDNGAEMGAVIVKRAGTTDVGGWYFLQPSWMFDDLWRSGTFPMFTLTLEPPSSLGYADLPDRLDETIAADGCPTSVPCVAWPRPGHPARNAYTVTTVAHGVRMLRAAGWGDPLETP